MAKTDTFPEWTAYWPTEPVLGFFESLARSSHLSLPPEG